VGGSASAWVIFLITWVANVGTALAVYALARRYGARVTSAPFSRWILKPHQIGKIERFYDRYGVPALAITRFLPAFRAVVPIFAGVSRTPWYRVVPPIALASGLWYGILIYIGTLAGANWNRISSIFSNLNRVLLWIAVPLLLLLLIWWWRTRRSPS